jgi:hypothetical protein
VLLDACKRGRHKAGEALEARGWMQKHAEMLRQDAGLSVAKIAERTRVTVKAWQVDVQRQGRLTADHG